MKHLETKGDEEADALSLASSVRVRYSHHVFYLPDGNAVLGKIADPASTAMLPPNPQMDYEMQKSPSTGIEAVSSISLGTIITATSHHFIWGLVGTHSGRPEDSLAKISFNIGIF